jgi:hypothetical protein
MRDMVARQSGKVIGPHEGGVNVIDREFGVSFRDARTTLDDLALFSAGVQF